MTQLTFPIGGIDDGVVRIRWIADTDLAAIAEACRDPDIQAYTRVPSDYTLDNAEAFADNSAEDAARGEGLALVIVSVEDDSLLGSIGFHDHSPAEGRCELGYWLAPWARGQGSMTRAIRLFCGWIFDELAIDRIQAGIEPGNAPSHALIQRAGFAHEGTLRSLFPLKGRRRDIVSYSLLRGELPQSG